MKILILSDLHLVSPADPHLKQHAQRAHFAEARRHLPALRNAIGRESSDFLISLGDLVDWYSDENRDFALEFLESLHLPWAMTPGNHDGSSPDAATASPGLGGWEAAGVEVHNRKMELDGLHGYLINSHNADVPPETEAWLREALEPGPVNAVFTHVPPDTPETRAAILAREPHRNLKKYVQSHAPGLFENAMAGKVDVVWSGHLHFHTTARIGKTRFNILPLSIHAHGKTYPEQGQFHVVDTQTLESRHIFFEPNS
ncbi:MAG: metallophosphoesterase [Verrucomicrobia bacterium]|nr:metallophosphoesterase [Verrucomicrobiota bacterium]MCH8526085.1 metallophosphoesterase [Kiritimatiellia bacterium]